MLGSLIAPRALEATLYQRDFESVRTLFAAVLEQERSTDEQMERAVTAQGMARAAELLMGQYTLVITNVPYLAPRQAGQKAAGVLRTAIPCCKERSGHRVPGALPGVLRRGRHHKPCAASELAVPYQLPKTPGEAAEDREVAFACPTGAGCL